MSKPDSRSDLNELLAKTTSDYSLRDKLNIYGIPEDESVTISIKYNDDVLASYDMGTSNNNIEDTAGDINELINKMLDYGEGRFGLLGAISIAEKPIKVLIEVILDRVNKSEASNSLVNPQIIVPMGICCPCPTNPSVSCCRC